MDIGNEQESSSPPDRIMFNVGGTIFTVASSTIMKHPETMLGIMVSKRWNQSGELFIDRDPVRFRYILDFYRDGKITIPLTMSKAEIMREVSYFALPLSESDVVFDASDIVGIRESATKFDNILVEKFRDEAQKRAVVAAAYEIAALLIGKMGRNPNEETISLHKSEVPETSFACVLCSGVLNDPLFKETISGLVEQAGYHFRGEINNDNLLLSR